MRLADARPARWGNTEGVVDGWFLVETAGDSPAVLMIGARSKQWRPLSNEFRGTVHKTVLRLVDTVLNNVKQTQVLLDLAGQRLAIASPVLGSSRQVHGVLMWIGEPTQQPPAEPPSQAWEWRFDGAVPELVGGDSSRPQTLTDWLSTCARPSDVLRIADEIRSVRVGERATGEWVDLGGAVHRYSYRCAATFDGPRGFAVSVTLPDRVAAGSDELLNRRITDMSAATSALAPALCWPDGRVAAWLSAQRPTLPEDVLSGRVSAVEQAEPATLSVGSGLGVRYFRIGDGSFN